MEDQIRTVLGDDRYAEYQIATDYKYRQAFGLTQRFGTGKEGADAAWEIKQLAEQKARELNSSRDMNSQQRRAALNTLTTETKTALQEAMGERAYENYSGFGTSWVDHLKYSRPDPSEMLERLKQLRGSP